MPEEKEDVKGEEEERTMNRLMGGDGEEIPQESSTMLRQEEELTSGMERLEVQDNQTPNTTSTDEEERQQDLWRQQFLAQDGGNESEESDEDEEYLARISAVVEMDPENVEGETSDSAASLVPSDGNSVDIQAPQEEPRAAEDPTLDSTSNDEEERQQDLWRQEFLMQGSGDESNSDDEEGNRARARRFAMEMENLAEPIRFEDQNPENDVAPAQRREVRIDNEEESEASDDDSGTVERSEESESTLQVNQESDAERDEESDRWRAALLEENADSEDDSETEEDVGYRYRTDEDMRREMEMLEDNLGGNENSHVQEVQHPEPLEQVPEVENQRVPSGDQEHRVTEALQNTDPPPRNPTPPSHPRIPISTRTANPTWAQWSAQQDTIIPPRRPQNQDQRPPESPHVYEQFSEPPQPDAESSCNDDEEFREYELPPRHSGQPPRYNEQDERRNRSRVARPFGGAPVNSARHREQERRDEERQRNPGPPPPYNDNRNRQNQSFDHRWNPTSFGAVNNQNTPNGPQRSNNRGSGSRASTGSGYCNQNRDDNRGPSTSSGQGEWREQGRREDVREKKPMFPGGPSPCRPTSNGPPRPDSDFRDDRSRASTTPECYPEPQPSRNQGNDRARNNSRRDRSPLTAANAYGYHPDPPMPNDRNAGRRSRNSPPRRHQGGQDRSQEYRQSDRSQRVEDRYYENVDRRPQDNRPYQDTPRSQQNNRPSNQQFRSERQESEQEAMARRAEEDRLSREFIKNLGVDEEVQKVTRYYENRQTRGPSDFAPPRIDRQNPPSNHQNPQWAPQQPNPGFNQQQIWSSQSQNGSTTGGFYQQNQPPPSPMAQCPEQQQQYGNQPQHQQMPPPNMGFPQPNWNYAPGPGPSYSQNPMYDNMQGFPNAPQPMGQPLFQQPPFPMMMMNNNPQFQPPPAPASFSGFSGGSSLPVLNFDYDTPPITIIRQILNFLEGFKMAGFPVYISTMQSLPNQVPPYFALEDFIRQHLATVAEIQPTTNTFGQPEQQINLL